jgi:DNA-binding response OmpR family regulator
MQADRPSVATGVVEMQGKPTRRKGEPVLLLDPEMDRAAKLAAQLELIGFPTRTESTGAGALKAIKNAYFATLIVIADLDDNDCLDWLDDLRHAATRVWMIVISPRCDTKTCSLVYRHGGDACLTAPASIDDLTGRLTAFQSRARPLY